MHRISQIDLGEQNKGLRGFSPQSFRYWSLTSLKFSLKFHIAQNLSPNRTRPLNRLLKFEKDDLISIHVGKSLAGKKPCIGSHHKRCASYHTMVLESSRGQEHALWVGIGSHVVYPKIPKRYWSSYG